MTTNASSENRFNIQFTNFKYLSESALSGQIPEFSHPSTIVNYEGDVVKVPGDMNEIGEVTMLFKLDEDYTNYIMLYEWQQNNILYANDHDNMQYDQIEYIILDAQYKPLLSFTYKYTFPTVIEQIDHTTLTGSAEELEFSCTFAINIVELNKNI